MIGVFVTFDSDEGFDESVIAGIAAEARGMFEGMPGLRNKFFTLDEKQKSATNFYVWDSEEAARNFFSEQLIERVSGLYGVRPRVEFAQVVGYVDNS
jgi:heme-degrading monooxygenase HmoA